MSNISRHLEVIYCDDIRNEVGNKNSYMGIYTSELTVPAAPVILSKLLIAVKAVTDISDPFESLNVRIVRIKNDEEIELLSSGLLPSPPLDEIAGRDKYSTNIIAQLYFMLSPFPIEEEIVLRVIANTEREELVGAALRIRIVPHQATQTIQ